MKKRYKAAIFDMDGTTLDTIEDLRDALNHSMAHFGHRADFSAGQVCMFFGSGARTAIARALATEAGMSAPEIELIGTPEEPQLPFGEQVVSEILEYYKPYYAAHCDIKTGPYPGIVELLNDLRAAGIRTAVVSNKPDEAVQSLCRDLFPGCFDHEAGERDGIRRKPAPDMIYAAMDEMHVSAGESVYIGDSEVDIQTAQNSGLDCICVDWGFRTREYQEAHGADVIVSSCSDLAEFFDI